MESGAGQHSVKKSTVAYWVAQYRFMGFCPMAEEPTEASPPPAPANAEQVSVPAVPSSPNLSKNKFLYNVFYLQERSYF